MKRVFFPLIIAAGAGAVAFLLAVRLLETSWAVAFSCALAVVALALFAFSGKR